MGVWGCQRSYGFQATHQRGSSREIERKEAREHEQRKSLWLSLNSCMHVRKPLQDKKRTKNKEAKQFWRQDCEYSLCSNQPEWTDLVIPFSKVLCTSVRYTKKSHFSSNRVKLTSEWERLIAGGEWGDKG